MYFMTIVHKQAVWPTGLAHMVCSRPPLTFDRLTLKLVYESHRKWEPSFQIWARWARPLGSRIIRYARDRRTYGRMDGQKQRLLPLPYNIPRRCKI